MNNFVNTNRMKRQEIIVDFMENMSSMKRMLMSKKMNDHKKPKSSVLKGFPTHAEIRFLILISHDGSQSIKDFSERFCMTPSAATQFVDRLVKNKFLVRKDDTKDRRKISIQLTEKGKKILKKAKEFHLASLTKMLKPLNDKELMQLRNMMQKVIKNLE